MIKLFGAKLRCAKGFGLYWFYLGGFISLYSKLIGSVMEGRKIRQRDVIKFSLW